MVDTRWVFSVIIWCWICVFSVYTENVMNINNSEHFTFINRNIEACKLLKHLSFCWTYRVFRRVFAVLKFGTRYASKCNNGMENKVTNGGYRPELHAKPDTSALAWGFHGIAWHLHNWWYQNRLQIPSLCWIVCKAPSNSFTVIIQGIRIVQSFFKNQHLFIRE